jgi:hypothetical protein
MSIVNAPTLAKPSYSGDSPFAPIHGQHVLAAVPIGHRIRLNRLFAGTKVHDARMINAALGATTTVALGFEYVNGEAGGSATAFLPATATNAAGSTRMASAPVTLLFDAFVIATVGGAPATGALDTVLDVEPL